jgi:hypothetical protein
MASQIAHIVYAKKYLEKFPMTETDKEQFLLGSVFPDIRRVDGTINREATHMRFSPVDLEFSGLTPFEAGWKFHLFCDMRREEILRNANFYFLKNEKSEKWLHPSKMLEDQLLYDRFNNWEKLVGYFNDPPWIDPGIGVNRESFNLWYAMIARYVEKKPDEKSIHIFLLKQRGIPGGVDEIVDKMETIRENKKAVEILSKIYEEII